jgi:hypothetical protein
MYTDYFSSNMYVSMHVESRNYMLLSCHDTAPWGLSENDCIIIRAFVGYYTA